jgi:PAS domain S-box-containing protein
MHAIEHGGVVKGNEYRVTCKDGTVKVMYIWGVPVANNTKLFVLFNDITESKRLLESERNARAALETAVESLRDSEDRFRQMVETAPIAMAIMGLDGKIDYINQKAIDDFGYQHTDIPTHEAWYALAYPDPEYRKEVDAGWTAAVYHALEHGGVVKGNEYQVTCRDGSVKVTRIWGVLFANNTKLFILFDDLTESKRLLASERKARADMETAVEALRQSEDRFRQMVATAPIAMAIMALDSKIEYINQKAIDDFGYQLTDIPTHEAWYALAYPDPEYRKEVDADWTGQVMHALKHGGNVRGNEYRVTCRDGSVKVTRIWGVLFANNTKLFILFDDLTQSKRLLASERKARADAEAADKAKDDFLAIVSHELRTPLTAILGWSWMLRSGQLSDPERVDALDIIMRNMQYQRQIVEDLIDVSSLTRGQITLTRKTFDLSAVLGSVCSSLGQLARDRGLRIVLELPGPAGVVGDPGRMQQVFWNLLNNAMKFSPEGSEVRASLRREGEHTVIDVQDHGRGITPQFLPYVFDAFRQDEDPLVREHGGLGLGLAIVKRIVDLHGGSVTAASAGKGHGALFTVRLPAAAWPPTEPEKDTDAPPLPENRALEGLRILVVEDDTDARKLLVQLLTRYGARVAGAADAEAALASLEKDVPDVMLCDLAMPGEDGCSLIRKVRSRGGKLGSVPAAALTALTRKEDRTRALAAGFQTFLTKPIEPPQIIDVMRALTGRR